MKNRYIRTRTIVLAALVVIALSNLLLYHYLSERSVAKYHHLFYYGSATWTANRWLGIPTQQNPNDVWIMQEIIFDQKPDFIIETGTAEGGSAALWATVLEQVNPEGRIITVDIENKSLLARQLPVVQKRVDFLIGSSTGRAVTEEIEKRVAGKNVLVILDSLHFKDHVLDELMFYSNLVPVGGYLIVQDTNVNGHPVFSKHGPGPWEAVEEFLQNDKRFIQDKSRERLLFTMHPGGYLKRVK